MMADNARPDVKEKPIIVIVAFPAPGHCNSCIQIAEYLTKNGYEVYFVGGPPFESAIKHAGAHYIENTWDFKHDEVEARKGLAGLDLLIFDFKHVFLDAIPYISGRVKECLTIAKREHPDREIVIIQESISMGMLPFILGAPLPEGYEKLPKVINFNTTFNLMESKDVFPIGPGLPPPTTDEGRAQVAAMNAGTKALFAPVCDYANAILKPLGTTEDFNDTFFQLMTAGDVTVCQYSPSLDYPRSDLHPQIRFLGLMPLKGVGPDFVAPPWLEELKANAELPADSPDKKKIIFVSQGTVASEHDDLLLPALKAFANEAEFCVIATLGHRGKPTPGSLQGYASGIVVDFIPYDAVLPFTDVFITNAGFGAFGHGVMNGVPMVMCGITQDKPEVCARAEMAGLAINLRTQSPSVESLADAVEKVLREPKYKQRSMEVKVENENLDPLGSIELIISSFSS